MIDDIKEIQNIKRRIRYTEILFNMMLEDKSVPLKVKNAIRLKFLLELN